MQIFADSALILEIGNLGVTAFRRKPQTSAGIAENHENQQKIADCLLSPWFVQWKAWKFKTPNTIEESWGVAFRPFRGEVKHLLGMPLIQKYVCVFPPLLAQRSANRTSYQIFLARVGVLYLAISWEPRASPDNLSRKGNRCNYRHFRQLKGPRCCLGGGGGSPYGAIGSP